MVMSVSVMKGKIRYKLSMLNIDNETNIIPYLPPYKCLDNANNGVHYGSISINQMIKKA